MGKVNMLFLAAVLAVGCASTGYVKSGKEDFQSRARPSLSRPRREMEEKLFDAPAETAKKKFVYLIAWNGIPVGRIIAEVGNKVKIGEMDLSVARLVTESNEFLSKIYRVEDVYVSYIDPATKSSVKYTADRKEGSYRKHQIVEYDTERGTAKYTNLTDGSVKYCKIKKEVHDPLSAALYFMTMPVKLGDRVNITVNLNEKNYDLYGMIESLDTVELSAIGSFAAFRVRPYVLLGKERVKKGHGYLYFSADDKRYPLYGVLWIPFGKVTATLRSVEEMR